MLGVLWAMLATSGQLLAGRWTFTEKAIVDRGTYFRLKVDFAYKGEPLRYDLVVGCNVLNIRYKDSSSTYEAGLIPTVWGQRMSDGKAVVVRAPDACRGDTTANGGVPVDFLPVMVVYDNADTVAFGIGYMTDDAYRSPKSVLRFDKATVERATRAEFDTFRATGPQNIITRSEYHSVQNDHHLASLSLPRTYPAFGRHCYAYSRWKLTEPEREIVRKYRPDGARYWTFSDVKKQGAYANEIREARIKEQKQLRDDGLALELNGGFWQPDVGALRRDGVQLVGLRGSTERAAAFYPADTLMSQDKWPVEPRARTAAYETLQSVQSVNVDIGNEQSRGFAYCYAEEFPLRDNFFSKTGTLPATATIDGTISVTNADEHWRGFSSMPLYIFESDEYVLEGTIFNLESTGGDV
ncbi:hypothetical protein MesoLj113a_38220 [Mesorhizobium sp. 113-1-2]|nr:Conserved domain protein [Mesorhizobium loti]BCG72664.1 hypothetical protein MesoLj113a_38220 [Mesorhizobium sp. 113-1-2]